MPIVTQSSANILGIASAIPKGTVYNKDIDWIPAQHLDKLISSIGVEERRIISPNQKLSDLSLAAANSLIDQLGCQHSKIGLLLLVTQTGDHQIPSTALVLQNKLGLSNDCLTLEVNLGCSGYVYALWLASTLLSALGKGKLGLVIVGDVSSVCLSPTDTGTVPLFSDASTATLIDASAPGATWDFNLKNDGKNGDAIKMFGAQPLQHIGNSFLKLDGLSIYNFALSDVVPSVKELMASLSLKVSDIDYFVFHQASKIINEAMRRKLDIPTEKFPYSLKKYGNTSSATIPLTICTALKSPLSSGSKKILMTGFGTGLSWGSVVMNLGPTTILAPVEVE